MERQLHAKSLHLPMACDLHLFICNALLCHPAAWSAGCILTIAMGLQELLCLGYSASLQPMTCPSTSRSESPRELTLLRKDWLIRAGG